MKTKLCLFLLQQTINLSFFSFLTAPSLFRLAAKRGEDEC